VPQFFLSYKSDKCMFPCPSETFNLHNLTSHHTVLLTLSLIHISVQATVLSVMFFQRTVHS
jgi:hypothetical protein